MKRILATGLATVTATVAALSTFAAPVKASDEGDAVVIGIGSALLGCAIAGCFNNNRDYDRYNNNYYYYQGNYPAYYDNGYRRDYYKPRQNIYYGNQHSNYRYDRRYNNGYYGNGYYNNGYSHNRVDRGHVSGQINQIYREALGRNADHDGLHTYTRQYQNGRSLDSIRRDIYHSEEARRNRRW